MIKGILKQGRLYLVVTSKTMEKSIILIRKRYRSIITRRKFGMKNLFASLLSPTPNIGNTLQLSASQRGFG